MTTGFHCNRCLECFLDPDQTDSWNWEEFHGERVQHHQVELNCPNCGSGEIEEVTLCPACLPNEFERLLAGYDHCIAHSQQFAEESDTVKLIREIGLLPAKMRT